MDQARQILNAAATAPDIALDDGPALSRRLRENLKSWHPEVEPAPSDADAKAYYDKLAEEIADQQVKEHAEAYYDKLSEEIAAAADVAEAVTEALEAEEQASKPAKKPRKKKADPTPEPENAPTATEKATTPTKAAKGGEVPDEDFDAFKLDVARLNKDAEKGPKMRAKIKEMGYKNILPLKSNAEDFATFRDFVSSL